MVIPHILPFTIDNFQTGPPQTQRGPGPRPLGPPGGQQGQLWSDKRDIPGSASAGGRGAGRSGIAAGGRNIQFNVHEIRI